MARSIKENFARQEKLAEKKKRAEADKKEFGSGLLFFVEIIAKYNPRTYLAIILLFTLAGYAYLLLAPAIVLTSFYFLHELIPVVKTNQDWVPIGLISLTSIFFMYSFIRTVQLKFSRAKGLKLTEEMTPDLHGVISEVIAHYKRPSIKNVVLTEKFECRIESIPRFGLPVASYNTLIIGLPFLQTMSPEDFKCELFRCIGQHSKIIPDITLFIYKSYNLWSKYNEALDKDKKFSTSHLRWLLKPYSSLYELIASPAIRMEELEADLYSLDHINEKEVFNALKSKAISETFLKTHYWVGVRNMVMKNPNIMIRPFANLEKTIKSEAAQNNRKNWLNTAYSNKQNAGEIMPGFRKRMEHLGHTKIRNIPELGMNSAEKYLGDTRKNIIPIIDKLWRASTLSIWVKEIKEQRRDIGIIKELSRKSQKNILWPKDIICYACLAKKLRGYPISGSVKKLMKRNLLNITPAFITSRLRSGEHA